MTRVESKLGIAIPAEARAEGIPFRKYIANLVAGNIKSVKQMTGKACHEIKRTVKSYEQQFRRPDWGQMFIDAMKYCLVQKYAQSPEFRYKGTLEYKLLEDALAFIQFLK